MAPVTEIALLSLIDGEYPEDAHSAAGQTLKHCLDVLVAQKGMQKCYWGRETENPSTMRLFLDWDSVDAHKAFTASEVFKPFSTLWSGDPVLYHARFKPNPPSVALKDIQSLATEIITMYFPASYSLEDQRTVEDNIGKLVDVIEKHADGYTSFTGGWVDEEVTIPGDSEKAKVYVSCVGWKSVDAHRLFTDTQVFKDNIHWSINAKDLKTFNMVHVHFKELYLGIGGVAGA